MSKNFYQLFCVDCGCEIDERESVARCPACGEAIQVSIPPKILRERVKKDFDRDAPISGKKYAAFYPLKNPQKAVSIGEGNTPLIRLNSLAKKFDVRNLYVKNEGVNPTGVFKDRGSLVEISKAVELGSRAIVCASTGNMAASVAAYSGVAGVPCYVLIPEGTPLGKLAQAMNYGARVLQIRGTYADCCRLAEAMAEKYKFYLAGDYAFRSEGQKSLAFEVVEQLGWKVPDVVIVPVGCGTNISAIWQGFVEMKEVGLVKKLPRIVGVQPTGCSTVVAAFKKKQKKSNFSGVPKTNCSAVGIDVPLDDIKALAAMRDSGGTAVNVSDAENTKINLALGRGEGIFVEPSGSLSTAAVAILKKEKFLRASDVVVAVATGVGLKDPKSALEPHPTPPSVEPEMNEIDRFLEYKLYAVRAAGQQSAEKILFTKTPSLVDLQKIIKKEFAADLKETHLREIRHEIAAFLAKGKKVSKSDLQQLVENSLSDLTYENRVMKVSDYHLDIRQKTAPVAKVEVELHGKRYRAAAKGVGPVDAPIAAIRKALAGRGLKERLTDYAVKIDTGGTDTTVEVSMRLTDEHENSVTATASSPDIITASIAAFEKGYNILFWKNRKSKN